MDLRAWHRCLGGTSAPSSFAPQTMNAAASCLRLVAPSLHRCPFSGLRATAPPVARSLSSFLGKSRDLPPQGAASDRPTPLQIISSCEELHTKIQPLNDRLRGPLEKARTRTHGRTLRSRRTRTQCLHSTPGLSKARDGRRLDKKNEHVTSHVWLKKAEAVPKRHT